MGACGPFRDEDNDRQQANARNAQKRHATFAGSRLGKIAERIRRRVLRIEVDRQMGSESGRIGRRGTPPGELPSPHLEFVLALVVVGGRASSSDGYGGLLPFSDRCVTGRLGTVK